MEKRSLKQGLIGLVAGTALLFNSGCMSTTALLLSSAGNSKDSQKGFFHAKQGVEEKRVAVFPPLIYLWPVHGGQYNFKKIIENNETIGYDISYHRWTEVVGLKLGDDHQKIRIPGARNMGIKQDFLLKDRFDITYELNGQKRQDEYHLGFAGDQCKLANQYIINEKGKKIKIKQ